MRGMTLVLRHPDPWPVAVTDKIKEHARKQYPKESCGVVVDDDYIPCENTHPEPYKAFKIDPRYTSKLIKDGKLQAIVHSHPDGPSHPSEPDAQGQIDMAVPWGIVPVFGDGEDVSNVNDIIWWGDQLPTPPLLGRQFIWHVFHCWQLYRDWWWTERGIRFATYPCPEEFIDKGHSPFLEHLEETHHINLGKPKIEELEIGDLVLGRLRGTHPNHCGVYIGNDTFLHHPSGGASCEGSILRWWPRIDMVLRHDGTQKPSPLWQPSE